MIRTTSPILPALLLTALLAPAGCGGGQPGASPEAEELAEERLTMDDVRRFARARAALAERAAEDSSVWRALRPGDQADPHADLAAAARALEGNPAARAALSAAGMAPGDYVRTRFALQQALLAHDLRRQGGEDAPLPAAIPPENVDLVGEHRDEIERLLSDAAATAPPDTGGGG